MSLAARILIIFMLIQTSCAKFDFRQLNLSSSSEFVLIEGVTGGSDTTVDYYLMDGNIAQIHWTDHPAETSYQLTLYDNDATTVACPMVSLPQNTTSHIFSTCTLTPGRAYWAVLEALGDGLSPFNILNETTVRTHGYNFLNPATLNLVNSSFNEDVGVAQFNVSLSAPSDWRVDFSWRTIDDTAVNSGMFKDYDQVFTSSVSINPGELSAVLSVPITDDPRDEDDQHLVINVFNGLHVKMPVSSANLNIVDNDDPPNLQIAAQTVNEGETTATINLTLDEISEKVISFNYHTTDGTARVADGDYQAITSTPVTFNPGQTQISFTLTTLQDASVCEFDETVSIGISDGVNVGASPTNPITIVDNDLPALTLTGDTKDEGQDLIFTATLSDECPAHTVSFDWHTVGVTAVHGEDLAEQSGTVTFPPSVVSRTFNVTTINDNIKEVANKYVAVGARNKQFIEDRQPSAALGVIRDLQTGGAVQTVKVVTSGDRSLVLSSDGRIKGWGMSDYIGGSGPHQGDEPGEMGDNLAFLNLGTWDHDNNSATPQVPLRALKVLQHIHFTYLLLSNNRVARYQGDTSTNQTLTYINLGTWDHDNNSATAPVNYTAKDIASSGNEGLGAMMCIHLMDDNVKCIGSHPWNLGVPGMTTGGSSSANSGDNLPILNFGTHGGLGVTLHKVKQLSPPCVILDTDQVKCWGSNDRGQLGLGHTTTHGGGAVGNMGDALPYVDLGTGRTAKKISRNCVILDNDAMKCWGDNSWGQLGLSNSGNHMGDQPGEMGDNLPEIDLGNWDHDNNSATPRVNHTAKDISANGENTCAILNNDQVKCWGRNAHGQLGRGNSSLSYGNSPTHMGFNLGYINLGTGRTAKKVFVGVENIYVIRDDDSLIGLGRNMFGALGVGHHHNIGDSVSEMGDALQAVNLGTGLHAVSMGWVHFYRDYGSACAVLNNGGVKCWGFVESSTAAGMQTADTRVGDDISEMGVNLPVFQLPTGTWATDLFAGPISNQGKTAGLCATLNTGDFVCWGFGHNTGPIINSGDNFRSGGQLARMGDFLTRHTLGGVYNSIVSMAVRIGGGASCALTTSLDMQCWGEWSASLVPNPPGTNLNPSTGIRQSQVGSNRKVLNFTSGINRSCALLDNYEVKCWGDASAALGYGDNVARGSTLATSGDNLLAVDLGSVSYPVDVKTSGAATCARFANGRVKCWGANGNGSGTNVTLGGAPGQMGDALPFIDLGGNVKNLISSGRADRSTFCGTRVNDQIVCWGENTNGILGRGNTTNPIGHAPNQMGANLIPVDLSDPLGAGSVLTLDSNGDHMCALIAFPGAPYRNNQVKCWGGNYNAPLGLGDMNHRGDGPNEMGHNLPRVNIAW